MSSDVAMVVRGLSKRYRIYDHPRDRLLQALWRGRRTFFRDFEALTNVSFTLWRGETVGIVGRNGSGKSTLLQMICGTLTPTAGEIEVHGRLAALLELGAGFNPEFTGRENVYLNAALYGLSRAEIDARFDKIMAFAEIGDFIDQPVKNYSSGMFVRLAFAVIAHVDADILVVDEALAVGDAFFVQKCMRFLRDFKQRGALLFVSHDANAINTLCDRAIWLEHGQLKAEASPKEIMEAYLARLYEDRQGQHHIVNTHEGQRAFGRGGATLISVRLLDQNSQVIQHTAGGEQVCIEIRAHVHDAIQQTIMGFIVKDRLGQTLFGDNTARRGIALGLPLAPGQEIGATFTLTMPHLAPGEYVIAAAVGDGTHEEHVMHHWMHEAASFTVSADRITVGLFDVPPNSVDLHVGTATIDESR